ncbi:hypothetical protein [Paucibacter sp. KBW04]|uniref:hypothetical protein n=1 Tax=Paucibacter sp. KBW04 TaxID=2153361 RepID=UPI000F575838|nr:hypothetical protein [Paucibacter sp. KBW04]
MKTPAQQGWQGIHRLREGYKEERTDCLNRIRGLLAVFGLVFLQSPEALRRVLSDVPEDASNELPDLKHLALQRAQAHWRVLDYETPSAISRLSSMYAAIRRPLGLLITTSTVLQLIGRNDRKRLSLALEACSRQGLCEQPLR